MNIEQLINNIPDKQLRWKSTTSRVFKQDLYNFLSDKNINNSLEIGTNQGLTSLILSHVSTNVYTIELLEHNIIEAKKHCADRNNITFLKGDAYSDLTYYACPKYFDVAVIDCLHDYDHVIMDINRALSYMDPDKGMYIIFDDYSHPDFPGVTAAINESIQSGLHLECHIGHRAGHIVHTSEHSRFILNGPEGIVLSYGIK